MDINPGDAPSIGKANAAPPHGPVANGTSLFDFCSNDIDETRAYVRQNYGEHSRVIHGKGPFRFAMSGASTGLVVGGRTSRLLGQTLRAAVHQPTLFLTLAPGDAVRVGRSSHEVDTSRAMLSAPGQEYTRKGWARDSIVLRVDSQLLEREFEARVRGRSRRWLVQSVPIPMTAQRRAELGSIVDAVQHGVRPGGSWAAYGSLESYEHAAAGWMAELILEAACVRSVAQLSLHRLARLESWIDGHLADDITLDRLCAVAGVSWRTLQKTMLAVRGLTPLEFVNSRRLAAARKRLQDGSSSLRVSTVALDCGFRHLGRFAGSYRTAYGELPAETARAGGSLR